MTATAHALVGGAIASSIQDPILGITLSAVSHPLIDLIPHWDAGWGWRRKTKIRLFAEAAFDLSAGVILAYLLFGRGVELWYFAACVFVSVAWDIAEAPYWFFNWKFFPFGAIYRIQSKMQGKARLPWGLLTQVVTVALIIFVLNLHLF